METFLWRVLCQNYFNRMVLPDLIEEPAKIMQNDGEGFITDRSSPLSLVHCKNLLYNVDEDGVLKFWKVLIMFSVNDLQLFHNFTSLSMILN